MGWLLTVILQSSGHISSVILNSKHDDAWFKIVLA